ncbi:MAG: D-alanine--D-alanine ligase family protein [Chloroflexota bacterium]
MNQKDNKLRIGIIFGGRSGEHEVSLMSARSVMAALDREKYEVVPIGITRTGRWLTGDVMAALSEGQPMTTAALLPDPEMPGLMQMVSRSASETAAESTHTSSLAPVSRLDVIFPVLHGTYGEDGTVQGLLELADIPYVGAGVVGSAVGMDKAIFKQVMAAADLPVLPWRLVNSSRWQQQPAAVLDEIEAVLSYPVFSKPANLGSSVGIAKCRNRAELQAGLDEAARYDRRLVVEQGIAARELEIAVLGNDKAEASVIGEVRPRRDFYDYVAKYMTDPGSEEESELIIPADLTPAQAVQVTELALRAYQAIDCGGLGRVDLLLDKESGALYINEINTIPGFTRISMYPKLWQASGLSYPELLDRLIGLALERHEAKMQLRRTFEA